MKIKPIHPYGPPVGQFKAYETNVAETIKRAQQKLKLRDFNPFDVPTTNILPYRTGNDR
jgi:hypothetical protein